MVKENKKWEMLKGPFKLGQNRVKVKLNGNSVLMPTYTLPLLDIMSSDYEVRQNIKGRWKEAEEKYPKLKPGLKFRLISETKEETKYDKLGYNDLRERHISDVIRLTLDLGITDYGVFVATNSAAKEDPEFARYLMENGKKFYNDEFAYFASPLGNCAIVESSDNKIVLIKRADDLHEYPGFYDTPGGHAEPTKHYPNSEGQFNAIKDEVSGELGIPIESIEETQLIGISVNKENFRKPDLLFCIRTGVDSSKMDPNEEVSGLEKLTKDELFEHSKKGTYQIVPPSEALLFSYYSLQGYYDLSFLE